MAESFIVTISVHSKDARGKISDIGSPAGSYIKNHQFVEECTERGTITHKAQSHVDEDLRQNMVASSLLTNAHHDGRCKEDSAPVRPFEQTARD